MTHRQKTNKHLELCNRDMDFLKLILSAYRRVEPPLPRGTEKFLRVFAQKALLLIESQNGTDAVRLRALKAQLADVEIELSRVRPALWAKEETDHE